MWTDLSKAYVKIPQQFLDDNNLDVNDLSFYEKLMMTNFKFDIVFDNGNGTYSNKYVNEKEEKARLRKITKKKNYLRNKKIKQQNINKFRENVIPELIKNCCHPKNIDKFEDWQI